jgi:hypothetical protein
VSKAGCDCGLYMENAVKRIGSYRRLIQEFSEIPDFRELFREILKSEKRWLSYLEASHIFFCTGNGDLPTYMKHIRSGG